MRNKKYLLAILIPALMHPAYADETDDNEVDLGILTVTTKQTASPVQLVNLKDSTIGSNNDLTRYSTDIGVPSTGRFGSQGFNIRGVENNRVAVAVDGVAQAESQNYATFSRYSYYNKSRPEVDTELMSLATIKKGASTDGNGAMGGAVNYQTKSVGDVLLPNRKLGASIKHTYNGKNKEWTNTLGVGLDTGAFDALALYSHKKGQEEQTSSDGADIMGSGRGIPNPYRHYQYSYLGKVGVNFADTHRLELKAQKTRSKNDGQELSYSAITLRNYFDVQEVETYGVSYSILPKSGTLSEIKATANQQNSKISGHNRQISIARGMITDNTERAFHTKTTQGVLETKFRPASLGNSTHNVTAKAGYANSDFSFTMNTLTAGINPTDKDMQAPVNTKTAYLLANDSVTAGKFGADVGIRFEQSKIDPSDDKVQNKTFNNVSGNVGAYYKVTPAWQIGYTLSSGYRVPTASEMYFNRAIVNPMGNQTFLANNNLKAETSLGHEIALRGVGKFGKVNASLYQTNYDELIDLVTVANQTYQSQNVHKASIQGVDVSGVLQLPKGFELDAGVGYAKGKRKDGASLLSVQPAKAMLGLGYTAPSNDFSVKLMATHTTAKNAKDAQEYAILPQSGYLSYAKSLSTYPYLSKAVTTLDLLASKKFGEQATFNLGVYNLTNQKYHSWDSLRTIGNTNPSVATSVSGNGLDRYLAPERYVVASVEVKF